MGYFWVSLYLRYGKERVSLDDCLLSTLCRALNRVLLHCRNQRALPRIVTEEQEGEEINDVAVIDVPRRVLPSNALHLGTCALRNRRLLLLCRWKRRHITVIKDVSVSVSRDVSATALAEVRVHVCVDVRVRHLGCFGGQSLYGGSGFQFYWKNCGVLFFFFCLFSSHIV